MIFKQAAATSLTLFGASALSKCMVQPSYPENERALELMRTALQWYELGMQDTDPTMKLQHVAQAHAFLQSARTLVPDSVLERGSGMDVERLTRTLDVAVKDARALLSARKSS